MMLEADSLGKHILHYLNKLRASHKQFARLADDLEKIGEVALVGGAIRDWALNGEPRDLDVVVDACPEVLAKLVESRSSRRTRYGGYHLELEKVHIDIWALSTTWAFSYLRIKSKDMTFKKLTETAFFNADAVAVRWSDAKVFQCGFFDAFTNKSLKPVFRKNPYPNLCTARSLVLAKKYGLELSEELQKYIEQQMINGLKWENIVDAQICHYGHQTVSKHEAEHILPRHICGKLLAHSR